MTVVVVAVLAVLVTVLVPVAVLVTRTDRLRFFRAYASDRETAEAVRAYARGVLDECRKKNVVRMEPIE